MKKTSILNGDEIKAVMAELRVLMPGLAAVAGRLGHDLEAGARLSSLRAKCTEAREKTGLSIKDVAQQLKVPQYRIKAIEGSTRVSWLQPTCVVLAFLIAGLAAVHQRRGGPGAK
jgi:hypothetical protein